MVEYPLVSIIVPIYNVQEYLEQCIVSIVNQTYKNLEIILVDDGSPDKCHEICESWALKDDRIFVIHKKNGGLSDARNAGINFARGKYYGFVDADDYISDDMYEILVNEAENHGAQITCCGRIRFDENGNKFIEHNATNITCYSSKEALSEMLCGGCVEEAAWDKLYLAELFVDIRYPVGEINEDLVTTPLLIDKANLIVHVGKPLYYYRFVKTGITKTEYNSSKHIVIEHINWVKEFINKKYHVLNKDYYIFQGRYSFSMCRSIVCMKNGIELFHEDYIEYKKMLKESLPFLVSSSYFPLKKKLSGILIVLGGYRTIKLLLRKIC